MCFLLRGCWVFFCGAVLFFVVLFRGELRGARLGEVRSFKRGMMRSIGGCFLGRLL